MTKLSEMTQEELIEHKKELRRINNKKYYNNVSDKHKEKMRQYYHLKKDDIIKLTLFINNSININIINEYNEALEKVNNDPSKIKINIRNKDT